MKLSVLRRSLIVRLVGMSLLLLLIVQAAGFAVVRATIDRNARSQIARELDTDENVWRRLLDQNAEKLRQGSALLAADYGFRSAVNSDDEETIQSVLENHGSRIGAEVTALLDTRLNLRSLSASGGARDFQAAVRQVAPLLASQPQGSRMAVIGGVPYQFVMVPMRAPVVIGWVLMGFPVSQPLADEMRQLLSVHVALLVKGEDGVLSVPVSTLPAAPLAMLRRQGIPTGELDTDQGVLLARASPLDTVGGDVQALLLRSVDEVVAPYRQLQVLLAIITVAGVLLFALGNGVMAQRVTTLCARCWPPHGDCPAANMTCRWSTPTAPMKSAIWRARLTRCGSISARSKARFGGWPFGIASRGCPTASVFVQPWWPPPPPMWACHKRWLC